MYRKSIIVLALFLTAVMVLSGCVVQSDVKVKSNGDLLNTLTEKQDKIVILDSQGNTVAEITDSAVIERFSETMGESVSDASDNLAWSLSTLPENAEKQLEYRLYPPEQDLYVSICTYQDNPDQLTLGTMGVNLTFTVPETVITYLNTPDNL